MDTNVIRRIKHSYIGRVCRRFGHLVYSLMFRDGNPVVYDMPRNIEINLYPQGEIAEFLFYDRRFERSELDLVAAYLKQGMRVIDVGANIGLYSILAHKLVGPSGKVWAFEPSSETYRRLLNNLSLNDCASVTPIKVALSDKDSELLLRSDPGFGDAYRYLARENHDAIAASAASKMEGQGCTELVPAVTLDCYATMNGIRDVAFLKIDIEGGEYRFFQGAHRFLSSNRDILIMFESAPKWCERAGYKQQDVFRLLRELGFGLYAWSNWHKNWSPSEGRLLSAEMVWACRDKRRLPVPVSQ